LLTTDIIGIVDKTLFYKCNLIKTIREMVMSCIKNLEVGVKIRKTIIILFKFDNYWEPSGGDQTSWNQIAHTQ